MKNLNTLHILGIISLLCALASFATPPPEPPGFRALDREQAKLVLARRGPVSFAGHRGVRTLGSLPGMWVFAVDLGGEEHRFAIDPPEEAQLRRLEHLEPGSEVTALVQGDEIWQLENSSGEVLVAYEYRAAQAEEQIARGRRVLGIFLVAGLGLLAAGQTFRRWKSRAREPTPV
jgi:hypothetical protein